MMQSIHADLCVNLAPNSRSSGKPELVKEAYQADRRGIEEKLLGQNSRIEVTRILDKLGTRLSKKSTRVSFDTAAISLHDSIERLKCWSLLVALTTDKL